MINLNQKIHQKNNSYDFCKDHIVHEQLMLEIGDI